MLQRMRFTKGRWGSRGYVGRVNLHRRIAGEVEQAIGLVAIKNRQPYGWLRFRCPLHPMSAMRRNIQVVTATKEHGVTFFELQLGLTLEQDHPFMLILIVPKVLRAGVSSGHDPFDTNMTALCQDFR